MVMGRPPKPREPTPAFLRLTPAELSAWRERLSFTKRDAAHALGCSRSAWAGWESGKHPTPKYIGLAMAALVLGIEPYGNKL
jgi:transcriptional regulator with XRE-family HTH domain